MEIDNFQGQELGQMQEITLTNYMEMLRDDLEKYLKINNISAELFGESVDMSGRAIRNIIEGKVETVGMDTWLKIRKAMYLKTYTSTHS